nr:Chain A, PawS Derived Peptide 4 (PDP-4) [unidentified]
GSCFGAFCFRRD